MILFKATKILYMHFKQTNTISFLFILIFGGEGNKRWFHDSNYNTLGFLLGIIFPKALQINYVENHGIEISIMESRHCMIINIFYPRLHNWMYIFIYLRSKHLIYGHQNFIHLVFFGCPFLSFKEQTFDL